MDPLRKLMLVLLVLLVDLQETGEDERDSLRSMKEDMGEKEIVVGRYLTVSDSAEPPSISPIGRNNLRQDEQA